MTEPSISPAWRRRFVQGAGAAVTLGGLGGSAGVVSAQELDTIRLGAAFGGYVGIQPKAIAGTTNPALNLEAGKRYEIVLQRMDPYNHNVVFIDEETNTVQKRMQQHTSDETQKEFRMEFEATEEMTRYYCDVHPTTMNGGVEFDGGFDFQAAAKQTTPTEESSSTKTAAEQTTPTEATATPQNSQTASNGPGFGVLSSVTGLAAAAAAGGWRFLGQSGDE